MRKTATGAESILWKIWRTKLFDTHKKNKMATLKRHTAGSSASSTNIWQFLYISTSCNQFVFFALAPSCLSLWTNSQSLLLCPAVLGGKLLRINSQINGDSSAPKRLFSVWRVLCREIWCGCHPETRRENFSWKCVSRGVGQRCV